jgi:hypothetical protein
MPRPGKAGHTATRHWEAGFTAAKKNRGMLVFYLACLRTWGGDVGYAVIMSVQSRRGKNYLQGRVIMGTNRKAAMPPCWTAWERQPRCRAR